MSNESLKYKTKKGFYWKSIETFLQYGLQFVVGVIMARLLTPEDYGITALPMVFMAIAGTIQDSGFCNALIRKPDLTEEDLSTAFYYNIIVGVILYSLLFCLSPYVADFYDTPVLTSLLRVTALGFLWGPLNVVQIIILTKRLDFKTTARIALTTRVFSAIVGITLAYMGYGLWSLVINGILAGILGVILSWTAVRWIPKARWSNNSFRYLWGFGNKLMISALIDKIYSNITPIVVGKYYSTKDLGEYNRAYGYANLPSSQFSTVLHTITFPVLSQIQNDDYKLAFNFRRIIRVASFVIFPIMFIMSALSRPLIIVLVTSKWESCIPLLSLMCFWLMWNPVVGLNANILQIKGRSDLYLRIEIVKKAVGFVIMCITLPFGLIPFICGSIVYILISFGINSYYTGKVTNVSVVLQLKDIFPSFAFSFFVFLFVKSIILFVGNYYLQIIIGGISGITIYLLLAYLFDLSELHDIKYMISKKNN